MKKSFAAKRTPRKIGRDDEHARNGDEQDAPNAPNSEPIVRRPGLSSKPKKSSSLRLSFGPDAKAPNTEQDESDDVFAPKKSHLSLLTKDSTATKSRPLRTSLSSEHIPFRTGTTDDQPTYSTSYLNELRDSTPSRPTKGTQPTDSSPRSLDIASKFGFSATTTATHSLIPSSTEIAEKKARRARLAQESRADDFISLSGGRSSASSSSDAEEDEHGNLVLKQPKKHDAAGRLSRLGPAAADDDDFAEGYDEMVEDGGVALGRRAERAQRERKRQEMAERIRDATAGEDRDEGDEGEGERDADEVARQAAYEAKQTAAGRYGAPGTSLRYEREERAAEEERRKGPRRMKPIPELGAVVARMRRDVEEKQTERAAKVRELEELKREGAEIAVEEVRIQQALKEAGERYEELRREAGAQVQEKTNGAGGGEMVMAGRGLESFGSTPMAVDSDSEDSDD